MKPRRELPKLSKKRAAADPSLRFRNSTIARKPLSPADLVPVGQTWLPRSALPLKQQEARRPKPIRKVNPERKARRDAKYRKYMSSSAWKALRLAVFERDGFQCTATIREPMRAVWIDEHGDDHQVWGTGRCGVLDEARTGAGLIADHLTYARFGHENLEDLRTLCKSCNARLTVSERANWQQPRRHT